MRKLFVLSTLILFIISCGEKVREEITERFDNGKPKKIMKFRGEGSEEVNPIDAKTLLEEIIHEARRNSIEISLRIHDSVELLIARNAFKRALTNLIDNAANNGKQLEIVLQLNGSVVELIFDDKELDLSTRQADIGIFMRRPKQLNYIQKKLIDINYHIYGSPKYLEKHGFPKSTSDLNKHSFISFGRGAPSPVYNPDWALKLGTKDNKKRKTVMKVNSVYGLLLAVQSGVGLAALPDYITVNQPNIVKVLPNIEGPITEAHFVYPQSMKNVARVQAFRNFLYSKISEWEF